MTPGVQPVNSGFVAGTLSEEDWKKREYHRNKRFPPEQVRKRQSYAWAQNMLTKIKNNRPEDNLRLLVNELRGSGGYFTKRGALVRYKQESMEQVILDYQEKEKQKQCNILRQIGISDTPTL